MLPDRFWILFGKKKNGEATTAELEELESILKEHSHLGFTNELVEKLWDSPLDTIPQTQISRNVWFRIQDQINSDKIKLSRLVQVRGWKKLIAAAVLLMAIISPWALYNSFKNKTKGNAILNATTNYILTQPGSKSKINLPDGTQVWLNANSQLSYGNGNFGIQSREVTLAGEAFFDVTKNEKNPFIIHTGSITITVKGTAFNVKAYPNEKTIETSLVRGLIEITTKQDPDRKILLKPNEKIIIPVGEIQKEGKLNPGAPIYSITALHNDHSKVLAETVWLQSRFEFDNEPMDELAPKMENWFNIKIHFLDNEIKSKRFSGVVEKETLKQTMEAMQLSYHFNYQIKDNELWIGVK
ncbi:MAG TPA: FecR family protein [Puia sp.]|jgi:transmembrane sensor|nr:FecR family protein [Puia sp.]